MKTARSAHVLGLLVCLTASRAVAQLPPQIGYLFPPGGRAGTAVDVVLGGYDWTPDMELFVHDRRIKLELAGTPGPVIVPEPPYWFGKKARRPPFLMPRETPATLTLPENLEPGVYRWQAANANGATATGRFVVSQHEEIVEDRGRDKPQPIPSLPATVSGQILKIEEVDRYVLVAPRDGPLTCSLAAHSIGSPLTAVFQVLDADGQVVVDRADTAGRDLDVTFPAHKGQTYTLCLYDADFRGNRSFVYRLSVSAKPRIVASVPAAGRRGTTGNVRFVGYGLKTGGAQLDSVTQSISFPSSGDSTTVVLDTPFGPSEPFEVPLSDLEEQVGSPDAATPGPLEVPAAVTGVIDRRYGEDRYVADGKKGDQWLVRAQANSLGTGLDLSLAVLDAEGKERKRADDTSDSTDPQVEFRVPADGTYVISVSDASSRSGTPAAVYRLHLTKATPGFALRGPELVNVPVGGKAKFKITAVRTGGFTAPVSLELQGLPAGVTAPETVEIAERKTSVNVELSAADDAATSAGLVRVTGTATIEGEEQARTVTLDPVLAAVTMKPPFTIDAEGKNDVTKWPRGTTFPAPVLIERDEGFDGEITLEMSARQGRHRQGITGPELKVAPGEDRILYPVFLPEWLETTRTSRMVVNGVAQVADPAGRVRYLSNRLKTRIGFLPVGALLKITCPRKELEVESGEPFDVPIEMTRARELKEPVELSLSPDDESAEVFAADPMSLDAGTTRATFRIRQLDDAGFTGEHHVTVRAKVLQHGHLPVVSETEVLVVFQNRPAARIR